MEIRRMNTIALIRIGHVAVIAFALIVIWWNNANNGHWWLTALNIGLIVFNLVMLWWSRNL
jgi:hypothetical protein